MSTTYCTQNTRIQVSFAKKESDYILQKRPIVLRSHLTVATPYCIYPLNVCKPLPPKYTNTAYGYANT